MRAMFLAFLAIAVISVGADQALRHVGFSSKEVTKSPSVRLD